MSAIEMTTQAMDHSPTNTTESGNAHAKAALLTTQYVMTIIGALANLLTLVVLSKASSAFSPVYLYLLKSQAVMDFLICVFGTILVLQTPMWTTGNYAFDSLMCHIWHGQFSYWTAVFMSIWNLVIIAYERYLAICKPFSHGDFTKGKAYKLTVALFFAGCIANGGGFVQVKMKGDTCASEFLIPGEAGKQFFAFYGFWLFVSYYSGPTVLLCILYGKVMVTLVKRRDESNLGESRLVNSAAQQMTRTAMTVTFIFILSMSWDFWYYLLGRAGLVSYVKNSLLQMIGIWLSSFNSVANPFVYLCLLPAFRKSAISILFPCLAQPAATRGDVETESAGSASTKASSAK